MQQNCTNFPILPDRHIFIKRSLNMIISQNKHYNLKLQNFKFAIIAHIFNKYKQNTDETIAKSFYKCITFKIFLKIMAARHGHE
jgi:hypothetical protein